MIRSALSRPLAYSAAILAIGGLAMNGWEDSVAARVPGLRVGVLVLGGGLLALVVQTRGPAPIWALRRQLWTGPPRVLLIGAALTTVLVGVSSHTNGCNCGGGGFNGLLELGAWAFLVATVVLLAPEWAALLVAAVGLGCVVVGVVALAGVHAASEMAPGSTRLAGTYGNSNYFAATQAMGLPIAAAASMRGRRAILRIAAVVGGLTVLVALVLSYSRSGLLAAGGGVAATVLLSLAPRRRLAGGAVMVLAAGLAVLILYPTFAAHRTAADFAGRLVIGRETDATGWERASTGLIPTGPSVLVNQGPQVLQVTGRRPGEGVSVPLGGEAVSIPVHLRFQARAGIPVQLRFGLEDDLVSARPTVAGVTLSPQWRSYTLSWSPSVPAPHARAYFWLPTAGTFELRAPASWTEDVRLATALPTRLRGSRPHLERRLARTEQAYIASRAGAARIALDAFIAHPLRGIGWERFPDYARRRSGVGLLATHDEYLRFAAELGILGLLAIALLCGAAGWAAYEQRCDRLGPALAGVLVAAGIELAFGNVLESPDVMLPAGTAAAVAVALSARRRAPAPRPHG